MSARISQRSNLKFEILHSAFRIHHFFIIATGDLQIHPGPEQIFQTNGAARPSKRFVLLFAVKEDSTTIKLMYT
jgi:hypothetical protein